MRSKQLSEHGKAFAKGGSTHMLPKQAAKSASSWPLGQDPNRSTRCEIRKRRASAWPGGAFETRRTRPHCTAPEGVRRSKMVAWLTEQDRQTYGDELLDMSARAALHAVSPALQDLRQANAELQRRLAQEQRHRLDQAVERALPDFRDRDRDPNWHRWLLGTDVLSGEVRQRLLNAAIQRGDTTAVLAFFKSYEREAGGTQSSSPAPGRTRSASSGKQTYTRPQIAALYEQRRQGLWAGREAEWARIEHDIFAAQKEGRVQGLPYLTK